jgi:hypothetical protein
MEQKITLCRACEPMCGLRVRVDGVRVLGIRGIPFPRDGSAEDL